MKSFFAFLLALFCCMPSLASANLAYDKVDANEDGVISYDEHQAMVDEFFMRMDKNSDGGISHEEFKAAREKYCKKVESKVQCKGNKNNNG